MLVRFKVKNYLSFNMEREFSMITGQTRSHLNHVYKSKETSLLKSSLIYGANAAGKSNFIKSIDFAKKCILNGISKVNTIEKHYRVNKEGLKETSQFEFEILIEDRIYAYGFSMMLETKVVLEEWLYEVKKEEDKLIFLRENKKIDKEIKLSINDKNKLEVYIDDLEDNSLLLEVLGKKKWESQEYDFIKVLNWFRFNLKVVFPNTDEFLRDYFNDAKNWKKYLSAFDTGIEDIIFNNRDFQEISIPEKIKERISNDVSKMISEKDNKKKLVLKTNNLFLNLYLEENILKAKEILFKHEGDSDNKFKFSEESDGTKRLLELIPLLERVKCSNQTIFIDELERSLHPKLVKEFLNIFYGNMEKSNSQVIISTHESRLLDLNNIRRDEVWFTERNVKEGTKLYSLEIYKTRFDAKIDKAYLLGRYGGVPNLAKLINMDIECDI